MNLEGGSWGKYKGFGGVAAYRSPHYRSPEEDIPAVNRDSPKLLKQVMDANKTARSYKHISPLNTNHKAPGPNIKPIMPIISHSG